MATSYTHSIPTPPFSPQNLRMPDENAQNPLKSTINLLDSLVGFYQHERMWVYRTRAMLENAFPTLPITDNPYAVASTPSTDQDYDDFDNNTIMESSPKSQQQTTRWQKRKKGFKLRIDGIRSKRVISTQPSGQSQQTELLHPKEQILDMFEKMMEARMESCQRLNKLVRDANRANLYSR